MEERYALSVMSTIGNRSDTWEPSENGQPRDEVDTRASPDEGDEGEQERLLPDSVSGPSATTLNSGIHILINIVSSLFLGAGNYCMQILVAPSREEITSAHRKGKALNIGVPSVKNLWHIERRRAFSWVFIGFVATILHIFWNSSIFTSLPVAVIPRVVVTSDFFTAGDNWTASDPLSHLSWWKHAPGFGQASANVSMLYALQDEAINYTYLDTAVCVERYIDPLASTGSLVIVARNISSIQNNGSSLIDAWASGWEAWESSSSWICRGYQTPGKYCDWDYAKTFASNWTLVWPRPIQVDHCLTGPQGNNSDRCGIHYSEYIIAIVLGCTILESLLIYLTAFHHFRNAGPNEGDKKKRTMVTMGDAIDNFLEDPHSHMDETNDKSTIKPCKRGTFKVSMETWVVKAKVSWFRAVSITGWMISLTLFSAGIGVTGWFIGGSAYYLVHTGIDLSPAALWKEGFKVNPATIVRSLGPLTSVGTSGVVALMGNILIANSPQVLVSFLYIFYNNILTRQVVADEWVRFLHEDGKKVLRVTSPEGMQRSSYFLSLPLKYSIPLMTLSILLHWLISQSIFLVQSSAFGPGVDGARLPVYDYSARGYSILGAILAISLGMALIAALLLMSGFRHYKNIPDRFQTMAFNSSAIEAMCQRPEGDSDARFFPIRIGVVIDEDADLSGRFPKVVFSTDINLQVPEPGKQYLQPVFVEGKSKWERFITNSRKYVVSFGLALKYVWGRKGKGKWSRFITHSRESMDSFLATVKGIWRRLISGNYKSV